MVQLEADPDEAVEAATEAVRVARASRQQDLEVWGLHAKGWALNRLGRSAEMLVVAEEALHTSLACDWPSGRALALSVISNAAMCKGDLARALEEAEELVRLGADLEPLSMATGEALRAEVLSRLGKAEALDAIVRALSLVSASGDMYFVLNYDACRGRLLVSQGRQDEGYEVLETATVKLESLGLFAMCVENRAVLAEVAIKRGELLTARHHLDVSSWRLTRGAEPAGGPIFRAESRLARAEGQPARAHGLACDGLAAASQGGHVLWVVDLLELVAITCADLDRHAQAARLLGVAERQRDIVGYARPIPARDELAPARVAMQEALGPGDFARAMSDGGALGLKEAVAYVERGRGSHRSARWGWESLTASEQRVVSLVSQHLTNAEIAGRLFVSTATVKSHLNRVFTKLGVANRGQLAAIAHRHEAQ
jgi:DNA-binding CsgD family transcriptional regulator